MTLCNGYYKTKNGRWWPFERVPDEQADPIREALGTEKEIFRALFVKHLGTKTPSWNAANRLLYGLGLGPALARHRRRFEMALASRTSDPDAQRIAKALWPVMEYELWFYGLDKT